MTENARSAALTASREAQAAQVWRFEQLVDEHSERLRRIELLLNEIAADDGPADKCD